MRHKKNGRHLNRENSHRKAMLYNLCKSIIKYEAIKTTLPKAKEVRRYIEPLITLAKKDSIAARRQAFAKLWDKNSVGKLFSDLGPRFEKRPGGYVRVLKCGFRKGDAAPMAYIELVERPSSEKS